MSGIFISHSSRDNAAADDLAARLRAQGYQSLFLDFDPDDGIPAGRHWEREIYAQLRACSGVVVLCSAHSMASDWCFAEITHARALGKQLFPLIIEDCDVRSVLLDTQTTDLRADREAGYARLWRGMRSAGLDPTDSFDWDVHRPPYPGLMPFQAADAAVYFGRDEDQRRCLDTLAQMRRYGGHRLLVLVGTSGSGKSSLVRAGVIPKLSRMPDWHVLAPMRPLQQPVDELAGVLPDAARARLTSDTSERALAAAAAEVAAGADTGTERRAVLLVIDQLEELVTISDPAAAARFVELLRVALVGDGGDLYCLATLRADYLAALQSHAAWGQMPFREMSLGPMTPRHFAEIISKPAQVAGIELEPGLVETMVQDTGTADALPLLAFTLSRLWRDFGGDGKITLDEYTERIGGLEGAIRQEADAVLAALKPTRPQITELRRAFRHMVRVDPEGQYTRRAVRWQDIPKAIHPLMEAFVKARLLVSGQEETNDRSAGGDGARTLEVAHEALFRAWPRLKRWLDEDRAFLLWRQHLRPDADAWQAAPKDHGLLLRGGPLAEAHRWLGERKSEVDDTLRAFISASTEAARRARQRWRALEAGIAVGLVAVSWLGVKLWQQRLETHAQLINSYWSGAVSARDASGDTLKAAHYFARVAELTHDQARSNALIGIGVLSGGVELAGMISLPAAPDGADVDAEDAVLVSWTGRNATLHDLHRGTRLAEQAHGDAVEEARVADQRHVVSRDAAGGLWLWGGAQAALSLASAGVAGIALDADRRQLLAWGRNGAQVWSLPGGEPTDRFAPGLPIAGGRFIGTDDMLLWSEEGRFWRWRSGEAAAQSTWQTGCAVRGVDLAGEHGSAFSWCDKSLARHDLTQGRVAAQWPSPESVDGARFMAGDTRDGVVVSWNAARGRVRAWNAGNGNAIFDNAATRDSDNSISHLLPTRDEARFITSGGGGVIVLWDIADGAPAARGRHDKAEATVSTAITPDGTRVLAWSSTAGARLWDTNTMTPLSLPLQHLSRITGAAFFDTGMGIATWSDDANVRVWRRKPAAELTAPVSAPPTAETIATPTAPDEALKARLNELGLHGYDLLDRADGTILVAAGPLARRLGPGDFLSPPLTLNEGVANGALLAGGRVVLWGNTSVQLWDANSGQPLSALLRSDVLYPESAQVDGGLLTSDGHRARQWRWPVPAIGEATPPQWLASTSATQMDAQGAISVMSRDEWCAGLGADAVRPAGC